MCLTRFPYARLRRGFTLFEVAISLVLVAFGVVSVLMLLPSGIRSQQMSRYQILASVRAMEMVDVFSSASDASTVLDREGPHPWDTVTSYRAYAPDLESRIATFRFGMFPLPLDLAKRLDSDGDEIQRILSDGGYVYYSQPSATSGFNPIGARQNMPQPNESQRLICAIVGYPQQNAIPAFSYKDWPYHDPYPSPPLHIQNVDSFTSKPTTPWSVWESNFMLWEDTLEADKGELALVFQAIVQAPAGSLDLPITTKWVKDPEVIKGKYRRSSGFWAYGDTGGWILDFNPVNGKWEQRSADGAKWTYKETPVTDPAKNKVRVDLQPEKLPNKKNNPIWKHPVTNQPTTQKEASAESALAYFALAKWYAKKKNVADAILEGRYLADDGQLLKTRNLFTNSIGNPALAVNSARLLAHAAMCLTPHLEPDGPLREGQVIGALEVIREGAVPYYGLSPAFTISRATIKNYYDNAMKLGMRFAASYPYDWGSPRVLNRATMMDFPLLQYDVFSSARITPDASVFPGYAYGERPASGSRAAKPPEQWQILSAQPITNIGRSICYPSIDLSTRMPAFMSNKPEQFTLARDFQPADRCREIVFWAVDWQSYEDFETAPSAPVDASRYPKLSPHVSQHAPNKYRAVSASHLMNYAEFHDRHQFLARNPEKNLVFLEPTVGQDTGAEIKIGGMDNASRPDLGVAGIPVFSGLYGADRNFNGTTVERDAANEIVQLFGKLDRGPIPKSVRLRAVQVGRFTFYDPRLPLVIR